MHKLWPHWTLHDSDSVIVILVQQINYMFWASFLQQNPSEKQYPCVGIEIRFGDSEEQKWNVGSVSTVPVTEMLPWRPLILSTMPISWNSIAIHSWTQESVKCDTLCSEWVVFQFWCPFSTLTDTSLLPCITYPFSDATQLEAKVWSYSSHYAAVCVYTSHKHAPHKLRSQVTQLCITSLCTVSVSY